MKTMKNNTYQPKVNRRIYHVAAYLLSFVTVFSPVMPSFATILTDETIQSDFNSSPAFERVTSSSIQYQAPPFLEGAPTPGSNIDTFEASLRENSKATLGEPTYIPIGVGDITTIIPVYPNYKKIGSNAVQARYVLTQIQALLGRSLIDADEKDTGYYTGKDQLDTLYANALAYAKSHSHIVYGTPLGLNQDGGNSVGNAIPKNMIWPELRSIYGDTVLVPIVYLTNDTAIDRKVTKDQNEFGGKATFKSLSIKNSQVKFLRDGLLETQGNLTVDRADLIAAKNLEIVVGGTGALSNLSGVIKAQGGDLVIGANSVLNKTIVYRYDTGQAQGTRYGQVADVSASGDVVLRSFSDIVFEGGITSGQNITLAADGNISLKSQALQSGGTSRYGSGTKTWSAVSYLQSKMTAEDTIKLVAGGAIEINSAEIVAGGHIEILAGLGITVTGEMEQYEMQAKGKFGKRTVSESVYQTVAIRSLLDAGKGVTLSTGVGDIALKASNILTTEGLQVNAQNGAVNLLMTTETDHYSYSSIKKGMFTVKTESRGQNIETGVPNTIVGGIAVEALDGINVEYEGDPDLSLDDQLSVIADMEGMSWINDVRHSPDVNWNEIVLAHEEWSEKSTSLSPAFAAVVAIAVAIATSGAGASLAGTLGAVKGGAMAAAITAGTSAFISQAALAVGNGAVNGDIDGALEDFASDETLKSIAVAMITAGAIAQVDATFFNVDSAGIEGAQTAVDSATTASQVQVGVDSAINTSTAVANGLSLSAQVGQAVTHAAIRAGAESVLMGAEFDESFVRSLAQGALDTLGEKLANKIGVSKANEHIDTATQYVAHAAVGCLVGTATATLDDGDTKLGCYSGAGGAVIGEAIGQAYEKKLEGDLEEWIGENSGAGVVLSPDDVMAQAMAFKMRGVDMAKLGAALSAFTLGGDVNIASSSGANAAEHNALFLISIIAVAAYTSYVSYKEGGLYEGLQAIGRGDDPLAKAIASTAEAGIELAAERYPEETQKAAQVLMATGEVISAGVKVVVETEPGKTVTRYWNEIPEADRNALIGAGSVVSMVIPAGVVAKLKTLSKMDVKPGDWVKDSKHPNWDRVPDKDRSVLYAPPEPTITSFSAPLEVNEIVKLDARDVGFSQNTVSSSKKNLATGEVRTFREIKESMADSGWVGDPVDVVVMNDGVPTSMDNSRLLAARQTETDVEALVHSFDEPLTPAERVRFTRAEVPYTPVTWGEAIEVRLKGQKGNYSRGTFFQTFPGGSIYDPKLTGAKNAK